MKGEYSKVMGENQMEQLAFPFYEIQNAPDREVRDSVLRLADKYAHGGSTQIPEQYFGFLSTYFGVGENYTPDLKMSFVESIAPDVVVKSRFERILEIQTMLEITNAFEYIRKHR